ncbi:MAG: hypothetical protein DCC55_13880 [Chloroflexi bacterium]|nr:MAG: hypothetical protein DCC55_13880 [Chloroflexota bacterium]
MKLSDAIAGYWLDKRQRFSPRTVESYGRIFVYLVDFVDDKDIEQVTADDVRRFLAHLADTRNLSRRSQHDAWVPLSSLKRARDTTHYPGPCRRAVVHVTAH